MPCAEITQRTNSAMKTVRAAETIYISQDGSHTFTSHEQISFFASRNLKWVGALIFKINH